MPITERDEILLKYAQSQGLVKTSGNELMAYHLARELGVEAAVTTAGAALALSSAGTGASAGAALLTGGLTTSATGVGLPIGILLVAAGIGLAISATNCLIVRFLLENH